MILKVNFREFLFKDDKKHKEAINKQKKYAKNCHYFTQFCYRNKISFNVFPSIKTLVDARYCRNWAFLMYLSGASPALA